MVGIGTFCDVVPASSKRITADRAEAEFAGGDKSIKAGAGVKKRRVRLLDTVRHQLRRRNLPTLASVLKRIPRQRSEDHIE